VTNHGAHAIVESFDVDADDVVKILRGCGLDGADMRDASVVDEDVNALMAEEFVEFGNDESLIGHVA
jgi:hypothetical protein